MTSTANRDPFNAARTYGVRDEDRTHVFNVSWNAFLPDPIKEGGNGFAKGLLNGWQLSGISTVASGTPIWLGFAGPAGSGDVSQAYYGTPDIVLLPRTATSRTASRRCTPAIRARAAPRSARSCSTSSCIGFPAFGEVGEVLPPYDLRTPTRSNHDITLFKNFAIHGRSEDSVPHGRVQHLQPGVRHDRRHPFGLDLTLETTCNRTVDNVPNGVGGTVNGVCDPTGGFSFTQNTINNFGKINILRGRRIIEFALKYYF